MATRRMTFRLYPNQQIEDSLRYHRKLHKDLYNAAVANRFTQYKEFKHSVDYFEQQNCLSEFKETWTEYSLINSHNRRQAGSMKQLGQLKRQKSRSTGLGAETQTSTK